MRFARSCLIPIHACRASHLRRVVGFVAAFGFGALVVPCARAARYEAVLASGERVRGDEVADWHSPDSRPRLAGVDLFDDANHVVRLRDNRLPPPALEGAFIEFFGGDVLPGQVVAVGASETHFEDHSPHLLVEPEVPLDLPGRAVRGSLRVVSRWIRRVVWTGRPSTPYLPSTLTFRDGRRLRFRSARWGRGELTLLLDDGIARVRYQQIAEIHLPAISSWQTYEEQLAVVLPSCRGRLFRLETTDGTRVTTSVERFRATHVGGSNDPASWYHVVQPPWSLDAIALRHRDVRLRTFLRADRVPLSTIDPSHSTQRSVFGTSWHWRRDRSVRGDPLHSGGEEFGWGLGVHAECELEFELPAFVRAIRTRYGLDRSVGSGGCAIARIAVRRSGDDGESLEETLHRGALLIGSRRVVDTGRIELPAGDRRRLVLTADSASDSRPPGSDPFDIRDDLDWLEPTLELDLRALRDRVASRIPSVTPVLRGWTLDGTHDGAVPLVNRWDASDRDAPRFRRQLTGARVVVSRRLKIVAGAQWIFASVARLPGETTPVDLALSLDGEPVATFAVPMRTSVVDPPALLYSLEGRVGKTVLIELRQIARDGPAVADWRALALLERPPGVLPLLEDDPVSVAAFETRVGAAFLDWRDAFRGTASLRVANGEAAAARVPGLEVAIRRQPRHGEYRFLRFAWRQVSGGRVGLRLAHDGVFGALVDRPQATFAFDAGPGPATWPAARRIDSASPREWRVVTRDLAADFGSFTLTGWACRSPDGGHAAIDHVYLARTLEDFDRIRVVPPPAPSLRDAALERTVATRTVESPERYDELVRVVAPEFSVSGLWKNELRLLDSYLGRPGVVRTHPASTTRPCKLRRRVWLRRGSRQRLVVAAAHDFRGDWRLLVKIDGETVEDRIVGPRTTVDGWLDLSVGLSPWAGRLIDIELVQEATGWAWEYGYWWLAAVEGD